MADTDAELDRIRLGDTQAFGRWLARTERAIRLSLKSFETDVDTEAVLQEALLRVWKAAARVRKAGPDSLLRYAITTARHVAVDEIRRTGREVPFDTIEAPEEIADTRPWPGDPLLRQRIEECFDSLPARPKAALGARLRDGGGRPDRVLAAREGMSLNTFHQNFGRARRLMADCLASHGVTLP
jgi:RNA polymerase sigma factor (sigma-70 family)